MLRISCILFCFDNQHMATAGGADAYKKMTNVARNLINHNLGRTMHILRPRPISYGMNRFAIFLIRLWQETFSPDHARLGTAAVGRCRFYPSCSEYAARSIRQYGLARGFVFSFFRVLRCNPYSRGGYDPPLKS